ncbi:fibronectin type III-like domain-contianing protein [Streptomyces sp. SID9727]|uniref:fibronectin type III-like domain-contianing protein n=1 Tax=Streptomyces sp. SID9727 TaxID=2706114 RepID=UPI001EF35E18|nr:fibronectin type III-like domain-contianing protein [Streptomyces sp. SID9727]
MTVTNKGKRQGTETVQLYATPPAAADAERRRLVGFRKLTLATARDSRTVTAQRTLSIN